MSDTRDALLMAQDALRTARSLDVVMTHCALKAIEKALHGAEGQVEAAVSEAHATPPAGLVIDRDAILRQELRVYLDTLHIDGDNIGEIRRSLFVPWNSAWNGWVRDETAEREGRRPPVAPVSEAGAAPRPLEQIHAIAVRALAEPSTFGEHNETRRLSQIADICESEAGAATPSQTWQPMETAPKDDQDVLVIDERGDCFVAWRSSSGWLTETGRFYPTHWMPLPAPPWIEARQPQQE